MKMIITVLLLCTAICFTQEIGARYLIITHDNFYDAIQPLAQWKHKKGMRTKVVTLSEIGSSSSQIRNYVVDAYNNWQIQPEFLLLVGAPNYLPFPSISGTHTDNYYTNIEGDIYNEILSGRLTVHNTNEAQTVVNKILLYEKTPDITDSLWFINACLIVREGYDSDDTIYWGDIHHAKNLMLNAGYNAIDTLSSAAGDNKYDVITCVNNGRAIVMYRGIAGNNWCSPFDVNPDLTQNGTKLPIVLSLTCLTLGTGSTPATAEKWLLTGTPATPRGASGYFATSTGVINQAYLRSAVARGFFDAVFVDNKRTFGEACEAGRIRVYQMYPYQGGDDEYYGFTTVGDPEMNLWTASPKLLAVSHNSSLNAGSDILSVQVEYSSGSSAPVESAFVCVVFNTCIYETGYTDADGNIDFPLNLPYLGNLELTVTGKNLYPFEATIPIICDTICLIYDSLNVNDSLGNDDGIVNNGETILLWIILKNLGATPAYGVSATISCNDKNVVLIESISYYGDILSQASHSGLNPYVFSVSPFSPNHTANFELVMQDTNNNTWFGNFPIQINGADSVESSPWLYITNYTLTDSISGNNNGIVEPGETIDIYISIKNAGDTAAFDAEGTLRCSSFDVEILDSTTSFGDIIVGSIADNLNDTYKVSLSANPSDSTFGFVLYLSCNDETYQTQNYFTIYLYALTGTKENNTLDYEQSYGLNIYPNPCRKIIEITYSVGRSAKSVEMKIYDITGRLVKDFLLPTAYSLLPTTVSWDGTDDIGRKVPQGVYFVRFVITNPAGEAVNYTKTEKVIFLR